MNQTTSNQEKHRGISSGKKFLNFARIWKSMFTQAPMTIEEWEYLESNRTDCKKVERKYVGFKRIQ